MADLENQNLLERQPKILAELQSKIKDASAERSKHEKAWRDNKMLSLGAHETVFKVSQQRRKYTPVDRISTIVVTQWAVQTEQSPRPVFVPRESNDPPLWYLKPSATGKLDSIPIEVPLQPNQKNGVDHISDEEFRTLISIPDASAPLETLSRDQSGFPVEQAPPPPLFEEEDFIKVDDEAAADAITQELSSQWDMSNADEFIRQNIFDTIVQGHRDILFQYDEDLHCGKLVDLYPWNVWGDRWARTNSDGEYYVILQIVPLKKAKSDPNYRDVPESLWESIEAGEFNAFGEDRGDKFDDNSGRGGGRESVERWTLFERNNLFDMDPEEAINKGLIEIKMEFSPIPLRGESGEIQHGTDGRVLEEAIQQPAETEEGVPIFTIVETGEDAIPGAANWPKEKGIRQLEMLGDVVLSDGRSDFEDIPIARNKNIPITDSPYGQGEPMRLAPLQELYNRLWTLFREYAKYFAQPQKVIPTSAAVQMGDQIGKIFSSATDVITMPDNLIHAFGDIRKVLSSLDPPQIQTAFFSMVQEVKAAMDDVGGTVEVLRGEAKSDWSGSTVEKLTNAARGPIGAKARHASSAIKYLAGIWANAIINYMPTNVWSERNSKYPPQILDILRKRIKKTGYDIISEVSGSGGKENKIAKLNLLASTVPNLAQSPTFIEMLMEAQDVPQAKKIGREIEEAMLASSAPRPI